MLRGFCRVCVVVLGLTFCWGAIALPVAAQRPITIDDYFQIHEVHDPQMSPDGKWIAYSVKTAILRTDKNEERIWMVPAAGGEAIAFDSGAHFVFASALESGREVPGVSFGAQRQQGGGVAAEPAGRRGGASD